MGSQIARVRERASLGAETEVRAKASWRMTRSDRDDWYQSLGSRFCRLTYDKRCHHIEVHVERVVGEAEELDVPSLRSNCCSGFPLNPCSCETLFLFVLCSPSSKPLKSPSLPLKVPLLRLGVSLAISSFWI
ncbi:hypothetical protein E5676_scaffold265G001940 [Cucumis melo var. makuwa]|uniref:Uncharacterized protein n=1 Tax=Cucumis melo var. makuwa TaxID=1194695 RepID=A0A5D3CCE5_CUCMM|nr:hypothetical protein E6C27_scaffold63G001220 [Cucumis melo var. makuwa]TYK08046.1 hypothetical protein E5676_scaffold265G001940 [Cucumis melo var. makuwa]